MRIDSDSLSAFLDDLRHRPPESNEDELFSLDSPDPFLTITVKDRSASPLGYLVIDTLIPGICSGGIRMAPDVTVDEVTHLARAMTHKFAFKNSYIGGAKAGIMLSPDDTQSQKTEALETFGKKLAPIMKTHYSPGGDIGVGTDELDFVKKGAGLSIQKRPGAYKGGFSTAFGVFATVKFMAERMAGTLSGSAIALEGYGNVGKPLARLLSQAGAKIVSLSTIHGGLHNGNGLDIDRMETQAEKWGDLAVDKYENAEKIDKADLFTVDADILIPGARAWSIHENNAGEVKAKAVIPAANIPVTRNAAEILRERGIVYIPEFVTTGGGILGGQLFNRGFKQKDVMHIMTKTYETKLAKLVDLAEALAITIEEQALQLAKANFIRGKEEEAFKRSRRKYYFYLLKKEKSILPFFHRAAGRLYARLHDRFTLPRRFLRPAAMADVFRYTLDDTKYYPRMPSSRKKK
jgi:glutamate dehydrogenase (NAD(P)+)